MTAIPSHVSDRLTAPLRQVAQRQWYVMAVVGVLKTLVVGLVALLVAAMVLGSLQNLWMPVRIALAAVAWLFVVGSAVRFLRPALGHWSLGRAALQVEHEQPGLQERLSSAVELSAESDPAFRGSQGLIDHLIRQAESDAAAVKPQLIIRTDGVVRWSLLFAPVLVAWMLVAVLPATSGTAMAGLYRVLMPWRAALPTPLTQVAVLPGDVTLTGGEALDISARVSFASGGAGSLHASLVRVFDNGQKLTDEMEQAGPRDFRTHFDNLQQTFSYKVSTDLGDSAWYKATVHPRPQITGVEVRCEFPAYTGLSPTIETSREGAIEALVGTRVTLTVHTSSPVVEARSRIVLDEASPEQLTLPLKQVQSGKADYQAQLIVNHSGEYKVNLANEFDLTNNDEQPRSIVAQPDEVPTIVIESPEPQITVRPDDTVPVKYVATDDYGISKIEAVLQIDDHPPFTVPVNFNAADKRSVTGPAFPIAVESLLKSQKLTDADHLTYQLKVSDNRDPDPQFSFSTKQTLKINKNEYQSFQSKADQKMAQDLMRAIEKAINELNRSEQQVQVAKDRGPQENFEEAQRKQLHEAAQGLPRTSKDLAKAADAAMDTAFADVAKAVKQIANKPIRSAAEDAAQADLNADHGQDRKDAATRSSTEIRQAREQLQKLLEKQAVQKDQRAAEAARDLAEAAKKQEEAAQLMKPQEQVAHNKDPQAHQEQQQAMHKQEQANQKLRQAMEQSEALRDPKAQETAQKLEDLIRKVEDLQKQQEANAEQTDKQQDANDVQQKANAIAKQQEALNKEIQQSAEQNKQAMQQANANPPGKDQQDNIVKALDRNDLQQAHDQMKQAANQLHQEAQQLQNQANSNDVKPGNQQQQDAQNKDQQEAQNAQNEKNQAAQAADALKQEANQKAVPKADDGAIKNAEQAAKEIEKQAEALNPQNAQAKQEAQAAEADAQAAGKAAEQAAAAANPQEAQQDLNTAAQDLNKAAGELADAAKQNQDADKAQMLATQKQAAQAAADAANQEAKEQDALAKAIESDQKDLADARQNQQPADQAAQQQNQIADQTRAAEDQAKNLEHQAQEAKNANVAKRAEEAQKDLAEARGHAADAAKAEQQAAQDQQQAANAANADQADAADKAAAQALGQAADQQQQAQDALARAETQLRDLPSQMAKSDQPASDAAQPDAGQQAAQAAQEAAQAQQEATQQNPAAAQEAANALHQAAQAMAKAAANGALPGMPDNADDPGQDPSQDPSKVAGKSPDSKQGISSADGSPISLPASVRDIGITADQWAKLPALAKKDLLNAAQQSGPPAYRQMIKDYYVRVAKMQGPVARGQ